MAGDESGNVTIGAPAFIGVQLPIGYTDAAGLAHSVTLLLAAGPVD
ncbi:MAG: hypothetical protein JWM50_2343 [Microbacteriaceae bacterium]|nr:hypothetical protein [Microbacteriaceae bacterium]